MAEEHAVIVLDDLEKAEGKRVEGAEPFYFCFTNDPSNVELKRVDLVPGNRAELLDILKPYIDVATRVKRSSKKAGKRPAEVETLARVKKSSAGGSGRSDAAAIREWALKNDYKVSERGRIPNEVVEKYDAIHGIN